MNREVHVPFCEMLREKFPQSTYHQMHWVLLCRLPEKNDKSNKFSLHGRRQNAGWSNDYMAHLLFGCTKKPMSAENSFNA